VTSSGELLRATLFHTPRDPFHHEDALVAHQDGALLIIDGRIQSCGEYSALRWAHPDANLRDLRGGFLLPGFIDTHIHYPQVRIIGSLGRSLLDWLDLHTLPEESRFADEDYARIIASQFVTSLAMHGTTTALVFGSHFSPATAALFETAHKAGLRFISGLVLSDRLLRPELHQSPNEAYRESKALIQRFHSHGRLHYAVHNRSNAGGLPDAAQRTFRRLLPNPYQ
jgi:guanine deaminase